MAFKSYAAPGKFNPRRVQDQTQKMIDNANDNHIHAGFKTVGATASSFLHEGSNIKDRDYSMRERPYYASLYHNRPRLNKMYLVNIFASYYKIKRRT